MLYNRPINSALPEQQCSYKKKFLEKVDKNGHSKWMKDCLDALEALGRYSFFNNIDLRKNYEIMEGRFNMEDYIDTFDAYDLSTMIYQEMKLPSFLKHYDITTKAVKLLLGEFIKRADTLRVVAKGQDISNERLRIKTELVWDYLKESINQEITGKLTRMGIDPNKNDFENEEEASQYKEAIKQKYQELTPQSIEKYLTYDFRTTAENWGHATMLDDMERFRIREQDIIEFYDKCVVDRCFSHLFLTPAGYSIETWNPLTVFYQYNTQNKNIEDLAFVGRILYMSKTEVIDYFGWRMSKSQLESLYPESQKGVSNGDVYKEAFNATMYPFADFREYNTLTESLGAAVGQSQLGGASPYGVAQFGFYPGTDGTNYMFAQSDIVQVTQTYWKSQKKVGKLNLLNPDTGKVEVLIVDETFDPKLFGIEVVEESYQDSDIPNTICWTWITEAWRGNKININYDKDQTEEERNSIYVDIRPCEFQFRGNDPRLIYNCKLPVVGNIFNNRNGRSQAVVDLLKPYQVLVNAFYNQAYHVAQKNNGKFFIMGASLMNNIKDWGGEEAQEKFQTAINNLGFAVVDDSNTNALGSMQYGMKVLDMDESERITRLINLAMLVEQQGFMQLGITPQRQGQIKASETVGNADAAQEISYVITEIYFEQFTNYRRRKFQMLLELAQYVESEGEGDIVKQYTTSDLGQSFVRVAKTDLLLKDLGVYVVTSGEEQRKKNLIEQLLLKNNQSLMPLSKLIETIRLDNLTDIQKKLEEQEKVQMQQAQQAREQEMQMEQAKLDHESAENQKDREKDIYIAQLKANADLQKITLQGIANEGSFDQNADLTDKLIAQKDLALKENQANQQAAMQRMQLTNQLVDSFNKNRLEKDKQIFEKGIKDKEHKSKQQIETQKLKQIDSQNKNQEKLAKMKHESDMAIKDKDLQLKELDKKIKEMEMQNSKKEAIMELKQMQEKIKLEREMALQKAKNEKIIGDAKAEQVEKMTKVKAKEAEELARIKTQEAKKTAEFKAKEIEQTSEHKIEQNEQKHLQKLKENEESHKQKIKQLKIKPKIKKK